MSIFAIGDLHLSLGCDKPMDIFKGWTNYVERLEENWNRVVGDDDTVVVPGDISWAMTLKDTEKDFEFINNRLNGRKLIFKGNHDYWWTTMAKMNAFLSAHAFNKISILNNNAVLAEDISIAGSRGWINDESSECDLKVLKREAARLETSILDGKRLGGEVVAFLHYPPIYNGIRNDLILEVLEKHGIKRCYYGHIHGIGHKYAFEGVHGGVEYKMISADYVGFMPVRLK